MRTETQTQNSIVNIDASIVDNVRIAALKTTATLRLKDNELIVDRDLQIAVERAKELKQQYDAIKAQLDGEKEYIKDRLGDKYKKLLNCDGTVAAQIVVVAGGERINVKKLFEKVPNVYDRLQKLKLITKSSDSVRVLIK